ncbi:TetR/AcrR family transcriptional regulator [Kitasatospora sp. NPDC094011]|uniref:TetR/AcrR family transcriptional regulator n=1 Tax=Kitasatospora sp. NPDC094011 TaxID=3364090 RepID=UPI0037F2362F
MATRETAGAPGTGSAPNGGPNSGPNGGPADDPDGEPAGARPRASAKGEQTRARLVAAARTLLSGDGAGRFTTRNVAALCGVSHGMCHYHFADRTELIVAVVVDIRPEWIAPLERTVDGPGGYAERAGRVLALLTRPESPDLARLHAALHWLALDDDRVRTALEAEYARWRAAFVRLFRCLVEERGAAADPVPLGEALAAAVDGLAAIGSLDGTVDDGRVLRTLLDSLSATV